MSLLMINRKMLYTFLVSMYSYDSIILSCHLVLFSLGPKIVKFFLQLKRNT